MAFRTSWTNSTPADPVVITFSGGTTSGDILLAYAVTDTSAANDLDVTPSGWTSLVRSFTTSIDNMVFRVWWKVADGTETSVSIDSTSGTTQIGGVLAYSGRSTSSPPNIASPVDGGSTSTSTTTLDLSITPTVNGTDLVFINGTDDGNSNYTFTFSTQSGTTGAWTQRTDQNSGFFNVASADSTQTTAGAVTARVTTDVSGGQCGILLALAPGGPTITAQPSDTTVSLGQTANFSVTATGTGSLTYQWQSRVLGASYSNISGATSSSYATPACNAADNNTFYRCNVTDTNGTTPTRDALLRVNPNTSIGFVRT